MAGTVTHLVIADRLLAPLQIQNPSLFYCGNLAPDAIMNRVGYEREMKRHTHFKDQIRLNDLRLPHNYAKYQALFTAFQKEYLHPDDKDYELFLGYVTHMLADEVFVLTVRDSYVDRLRSQGLDPDDPANFKVFVEDLNANDWRLVRDYPFSHTMPDILLQSKGYEIPGYITSAELEDSKQYIIDCNFRKKHFIKESEIYTFAIHEQYIEDTVSFILDKIKR